MITEAEYREKLQWINDNWETDYTEQFDVICDEVNRYEHLLWLRMCIDALNPSEREFVLT